MARRGIGIEVRRPTTPCSGRRSRLRRDLEWLGEGCAPAAADGRRYVHTIDMENE
jgi:hypothetical protein